MNVPLRVRLDFPPNPTDGDEYAAPNGVTYAWDGAVWVVAGAGAADALVPIGPTPPDPAAHGQLWWRNDPDANLYIRYNDGFDFHWVPASSTSGGGVDPGDFVAKTGDTMTGDLSVTNPATSGAASVALRNLFGNPTIQLTQPNAGAAANITFNYGGAVGWGVSAEANVFHVYHQTAPGNTVNPISIAADNHVELVRPRTVSGDPVDDDDLARKAYVDSLLGGGNPPADSDSFLPRGTLGGTDDLNAVRLPGCYQCLISVANLPPVAGFGAVLNHYRSAVTASVVQEAFLYDGAGNYGGRWHRESGNDGIAWRAWIEDSNTGGIPEPTDQGVHGRIAAGAWERAVALTGDTMTGPLEIDVPLTIGVGLLVSGSDAASIALKDTNNNQPVWEVTNSFVGQVGQTVGFNISRLTPAGAPVDTPFTIDNNSIIRARTIRTLAGDPVGDDDLARKAYVDAICFTNRGGSVGTDINTIQTIGSYSIGNAVNVPPGFVATSFCIVNVFQTQGITIQEVYEIPVTQVAPSGKWVRQFSGGQWSNWAQLFPGSSVAEPPDDGRAYVRQFENWAPARYLPLDGGVMAGPLELAGNPAGEDEAVNKRYVDGLASTAGLYQGPWRVAANDPDLGAVTPSNGWRYLCQTADPDIPEAAPAGLPGIGGRLISDGSFIIWDEPAGGQWDLIANTAGGMSQDAADLRYLRLNGGTLTGNLTVQSGTPIARVASNADNARATLAFGNATRDHFQLFRNNGATTLSLDRLDDAGIATGVLSVSRANGDITVSDSNLIVGADGRGIDFASGNAWLHKVSGTGLVFHLPSGNQPLQVENNDGSARRAILDTVNGDARYPLRAEVPALSPPGQCERLTRNGHATVLTLRIATLGGNPGPNIFKAALCSAPGDFGNHLTEFEIFYQARRGLYMLRGTAIHPTTNTAATWQALRIYRRPASPNELDVLVTVTNPHGSGLYVLEVASKGEGVQTFAFTDYTPVGALVQDVAINTTRKFEHFGPATLRKAAAHE
jgi:hypothetical protein